MAKPEPRQPSPKLQALVKEFQAISGMAGFMNYSIDPPQLRMQFTLYGRVRVATEAEAAALGPKLQAWCERLGQRMHEDSSASILPPLINISLPQALENGGYIVIATMSFTTKVTDQSYYKAKTALLAAYQEAVRLRDQGFKDEAAPAAPAPPVPDGSDHA